MELDLIIRKATIVDGSGGPPFKADVGIKGETIRLIGDLSGETAESVINAEGLILTPGFIDMHNHSDVSIFELPSADNYIMQGVTSIVVGNCGYSAAPLTEINRAEYLREIKTVHPEVNVTWNTFEEYLSALNKLRPSLNVIPLVGHGTVRSAVLGFSEVRPSERDLEQMKAHVIEALKAGAFGLSTGLIYVPSMYGDKREILELSKEVAKHGGIYSTHIRGEGVVLLNSIIEAIEIGIEAGIGVEISHLKSAGRPNWGKVRIALDLITDYAMRGYDISADAYPYEAWSTSLTALLPDEFRSGSTEEVLKKLSDPNVVEILKMKPGKLAKEEGSISWEDIEIAFSLKHKDFEGQRISHIAEKLGIDPVEVIVKLLIDDELTTDIIGFTINQEDVERVISHPLVAIGSDGYIRKFGKGKPHPRSYGTFPRVIAKFVREKKVVALTEAIRKMTLLPATKLKIWDRGLIRPGFKADLVIFDYFTINDTATFNNPHSFPTGIKWVIVNGKIVVENGKISQDQRPGYVLRKSLIH